MNNEPAFPSNIKKTMKIGALETSDEKEIEYFNEGMTIRDFFASKALQGLLSGRGSEPVNDFKFWTQEISKACYEYADAMLKERSTTEGVGDR